jgi:hypothetical protein
VTALVARLFVDGPVRLRPVPIRARRAHDRQYGPGFAPRPPPSRDACSRV